MTFQAIYKGGSSSSSSLIIGDPEGTVGVITLWSKAKEIAKKLDTSKYCVIGQLFSAERGLDILVRNLLANPQITNLVITGVDFSKSGIVLMDFFEKGFVLGKAETTEKECWRVNSDNEGYIGLDIPENSLQKLRESIKAVKAQDISTFDFSTLKKPEQIRTKEIYLKPEEKVKQYVGEYVGHVVRGKTIAEVWLKLLDSIMKFGKISGTHYDDQQKEIVDLLSIITDEDPYKFYIPEFLPQDEKHMREYIPRITKDMPGGIHKNEYTYGSRMRSWFGDDQVKNAIAKLVREPNSRAVVIGLWDPNKDLVIGGSPCLNHIWLRINEKENKLYMTCIFRSHDMFEGYPENAFGLRALQEEIRKELTEKLKEANKSLDLKLGDLIILSQSAHVYDDCWETVNTVLKKHLTAKYTNILADLDPRGNFVISVDFGSSEIVIEHTSPTNVKIGEFRGKTAEELRNILTKEKVISLIPHALDLGMELQKAEIALKLGLHYKQDQPLDFSVAGVKKEAESD